MNEQDRKSLIKQKVVYALTLASFAVFLIGPLGYHAMYKSMRDADRVSPVEEYLEEIQLDERTSDVKDDLQSQLGKGLSEIEYKHEMEIIDNAEYFLNKYGTEEEVQRYYQLKTEENNRNAEENREGLKACMFGAVPLVTMAIVNHYVMDKKQTEGEAEDERTR